jgi:glycosyltransferase involved in cell wall biosynthesis
MRRWWVWLLRIPGKGVVGRHYHDEVYRVRSGWKRRVLLGLEAAVNRLADAIVVPSAAMRDLLVSRQKVAAAKVHVVPYGFDFTAERYRIPGCDEVDAARSELKAGAS